MYKSPHIDEISHCEQYFKELAKLNNLTKLCL